MVHAWTQQQQHQHPRVAIAPPQTHYAMPYPYQTQGTALYPPGAMIPFVYRQPPQGVPMSMPPPHVTNQYAAHYPPLQQKVEAPPSQTVCNEQNRAVIMIHPFTREMFTSQLNSNVPEFVPGSKRSDQQSE
jgi:hypothetical protein